MLFITPLILMIVDTSNAQAILFPTPSPDSCTTTKGERGWCQKIGTCPSLFRTEVPLRCGFEGKIPIVCCPISSDLIEQNPLIEPLGLEEHPSLRENDRSPLTQKSDLAVQPPSTNFTCGERRLIKAFKIFPSTDTFEVGGGNISLRNSWPWMVLLGREVGPSKDFFCSGALINENYVLTAAHCVLNLEPFFVRLGEHDYKLEDGTNLDEIIEDVGVEDRIFHPSYELDKGYFDIALLKLNTTISIRDQVKPICLPWGHLAKEDLINEEVTVAGWGKESFSGVPSTVLREVNVTVFHPSICEESYSTLPDFADTFPEGFLRENIVCAGDSNGEKDACEGDSGGPMMHFNVKDGTFNLAAVISKGFGCGHKEFPGLYAPVRSFKTLNWIRDIAF